MGTHAAAKSGKSQTAQAEGVRQGRAGASGLVGAQRGAMALQQSAGNRAVAGLMQAPAGDLPPIVQSALRGGGQALDADTRAFMESRFHHDFSHVRVHADRPAAESARAVHAAAYTVGQDVVFADGKYLPESAGGRSLLAHELAHVIQQGRGGNGRPPFSFGGLEEAADKAENAVGRHGAPIEVTGTSSAYLARKPDPQQAPPPQSRYELTQTDGSKVYLSEEQYRGYVAKAKSRIEADLGRIETSMAEGAGYHKQHLANRGALGKAFEWVVETEPPPLSNWSLPNAAIARARKALAADNLREAAEPLAEAQRAANMARGTWSLYVRELNIGGEQTLEYLEFARDISFAIFVAGAVVLAAPLAAAGGTALAGAAGLTGTAATTTAAVTAQATLVLGAADVGATLRGTTSAAGQYLTTGKVSAQEVDKEARAGYKQGLAVGGGLGTGAAITATLAEVALEASSGKKVNWGHAAVEVLMQLLLSRFGPKLEKTILANVLKRNPEAMNLGEKAVLAIVKGKLTGALNTSIHTLQDVLAGNPVTWEEFSTKIWAQLTDPNSAIVDAVSTVVHEKLGGGASVKGGGKPPDQAPVPGAPKPQKPPPPTQALPAPGKAPTTAAQTGKKPGQQVAPVSAAPPPVKAAKKTPQAKPAPPPQPAVKVPAQHAADPKQAATPKPPSPAAAGDPAHAKPAPVAPSSPAKAGPAHEPQSPAPPPAPAKVYGPKDERSFADIQKGQDKLPEHTGPMVGKKLGAALPGEKPSKAPAPPPTKAAAAAKKLTPAQKRAQVRQMDAERRERALAKLDDVPKLKAEASRNRRIAEMAANSPSQLRERWKNYRDKRDAKTIKSKTFAGYLGIRRREDRGAAGEFGEAFDRGPKEIIIKAPKTADPVTGASGTTQPGSDMISYDPKSKRPVKLIDNKAVKNPVGKVSALEKNLPKNLSDDIEEIKGWAKDERVPPEVAKDALVRMEGALKEINAYNTKYPKAKPYSQRTQQAYDAILRKHGIDRQVTLSFGGPKAGISRPLRKKGFQTPSKTAPPKQAPAPQPPAAQQTATPAVDDPKKTE